MFFFDRAFLSLHGSRSPSYRNDLTLLCARLYPNGDGIGKGTHLSLFFVVMKEDYNALLPWPFRQKVSWCFSIKARPTRDTSWRPSGRIWAARPANVLSKRWRWPWVSLVPSTHRSAPTPFICKMTRSSWRSSFTKTVYRPQINMKTLVPDSRKLSIFLLPRLAHDTFENSEFRLCQPSCSEALHYHESFSAGVLAASAPQIKNTVVYNYSFCHTPSLWNMHYQRQSPWVGHKGKGNGIWFDVGGQTGKDCLITWADDVKVADRWDRTRNLSLRKRCTIHCTRCCFSFFSFLIYLPLL